MDHGAIWKPLTAIFGGAVFLLMATWLGANEMGHRLVDSYLEQKGRTWVSQAIDLLQYSEQTFTNKKVDAVDRDNLNRMVSHSAVYRYFLADPEGNVFWSSRLARVSHIAGSKKGHAAVKRGDVYIEHVTVRVMDVEGLLDSHAGRGLNVFAKREISIVYVPIHLHGKVAGMIGLYIDVTEIQAWFEYTIRLAIVALCIILVAVFLIVAAMVYGYGRERARTAAALASARDAALASSRENEKMADELRRANRDVVKLNDELADNLKTLRDTQDELLRRGKLAQLGQLTAMVAHEIRNPLSAVRTAAFLLERKSEKLGDKGLDIAKPLKRINNGIVRCDDIITELLDFARSKMLQLKTCKLDDWVDEIVGQQSAHLPKMVEVECHLGTADLEVAFDTSRMERVMINLLSNASEAMVGKGDKPRLFKSKSPKIEVATREVDGNIEVSVTDNGPGIDRQVLEKIREPLFTTKNFGVGIGLPLVEKILEQHGGGLRIENAPGKGACFTVWFPIRQTEQTEKEAA